MLVESFQSVFRLVLVVLPCRLAHAIPPRFCSCQGNSRHNQSLPSASICFCDLHLFFRTPTVLRRASHSVFDKFNRIAHPFLLRNIQRIAVSERNKESKIFVFINAAPSLSAGNIFYNSCFLPVMSKITGIALALKVSLLGLEKIYIKGVKGDGVRY